MTDKNPKGELLVYQTDDGQVKLDVRLENESLWLSLNQMASLFGVDKSGVSRHLKNIFETGDLVRDSVVAKTATTAADGKVYQVEYFNLDAIISVGYRVNSILGTRFRIWATERLREYIVKGFTMDDDRLKELGGGQYFEELLGRIRDRQGAVECSTAYPYSESGRCALAREKRFLDTGKRWLHFLSRYLFRDAGLDSGFCFEVSKKRILIGVK